MRLYSWGVVAVSLFIFGPSEAPEDQRSKLLHVEVLEIMTPESCPMTAQLARWYLMPTIDGANKVTYLCHTALQRRDLELMKAKAAADNAARAAARIN